ncbi:MAG: type I restriction-modification system subunit M [Treponema sp.]|nr:type I restriction-modification system subunit M [Treponema sp.]
MNKQQLAAKIWDGANKMRSKIEANEYKDYILGFIFYKFLSDKETDFCKSKKMTDLKQLDENNTKTVEYLQNNLGYFIAYNNLFSTWIEKKNDFTTGDVTDALSAFDRIVAKDKNTAHKKLFNNIFRTLQTGLGKLGDNTTSRTKAIRDLIYLVDTIPMNGKQDYDVLGFIYEYLISMFAANAGKKAGEFYTPHEVSVLMAEIIANHLKDNGQTNFEIYDPTSGSGSLLITIGDAIAKHIEGKDNIRYYAQELIESTYNLTRMNLIMRNISANNITTRNADTLELDWPFFDDENPSGTYNLMRVDAVVSNPPYSQHWDTENKEYQPRYEYGVAPASKADYAFLLHDLYHVKPDGIMTIVLPHGVLFRGKAGKDGAAGESEYEIRKNLIENNKIDTIIGLPANIFFGTGIPTIIIVLKPTKKTDDVLIIDASKYFTKEGKQNKLQASDIKRIVDTVIERKTVNKFSRVVSKDEIRSNDYNLNIPRYVDSSEDAENYDIYASVIGGIPKNEIEKFESEWKAFPSLQNELFKKVNDSYFELNTDNIKETVLLNKDVKAFESNYKKVFEGLDSFLKEELITKLKEINVNKEEDTIANILFEKLQNVPLVDKYSAYQSLDDEWQTIAVDLEIINSEGIEACKKVEPNLVMKGKDEVQDGWKGRIMDFELVQKMYFASELQNIEEQNRKLETKISALAELIPETEDGEEEIELTDEQKKQQKKLNDDAKTIRKEIAKLTKELEEKTIKKIEGLTDSEINALLEEKWILPLCTSLNEMPGKVVDDFISSLTKMTEKYSETLSSIENKINQTQKELFELMDELTGNEFDMKGLENLKGILA